MLEDTSISLHKSQEISGSFPWFCSIMEKWISRKKRAKELVWIIYKSMVIFHNYQCISAQAVIYFHGDTAWQFFLGRGRGGVEGMAVPGSRFCVCQLRSVNLHHEKVTSRPLAGLNPIYHKYTNTHPHTHTHTRRVPSARRLNTFVTGWLQISSDVIFGLDISLLWNLKAFFLCG